MSFVPRASLLFARATSRRLGAASKSTFTYEADKTFAQRWVARQTRRQQELQKFWAADQDTVPMWWKSTGDKLVTTVAAAGCVASFVITLTSLIKFGQGKL